MLDGKVTVQVMTLHSDRFFEIDEGELKRVHGLAPEARNAAFYESARPTSVHSDEEVDVALVFNGEEDHDSWDELPEAMGW